jgi:glutaredoxin
VVRIQIHRYWEGPLKLFVKNNCSACLGVEGYLESLGIEYEEVNIQKDYDAAVELVEAGFRSVPVLKTDGEYVVGAEAIKARV